MIVDIHLQLECNGCALRTFLVAALWIGGLALAAVLIWQGVHRRRKSRSTRAAFGPTASVLDIGGAGIS